MIQVTCAQWVEVYSCARDAIEAGINPEHMRIVEPVQVPEVHRCEYCGRRRSLDEPCRGCGHD